MTRENMILHLLVLSDYLSRGGILSPLLSYGKYLVVLLFFELHYATVSFPNSRVSYSISLGREVTLDFKFTPVDMSLVFAPWVPVETTCQTYQGPEPLY